MNNDDFMPMFEIEIQAGARGQKGDKGDKGDQGIQGIQGPQGDQGIQGVQGVKGETGATGNGVASVVQTTTSTDDGGVNVWTLTDTSGTTYDFQVRNGRRGSQSITELDGTENPVIISELEDGLYIIDGEYTDNIDSGYIDYGGKDLFHLSSWTDADNQEWKTLVEFGNQNVLRPLQKMGDTFFFEDVYAFVTTSYIAKEGYPAGLVAVSSDYGVQTDENAYLQGTTKTNAQYTSADNTMLISKGTLENVLTAKSFETSSNKVTSISGSSTNTQYPSAKLVYDQLATKLDTSKVKTSASTTSGDVYDATYINSLVGDINSALDLINGEEIE